MSYRAFKDEEGNEYGSFEVFHAHQVSGGMREDSGVPVCPTCNLRHEPEEGWYWWACFPGCLPDGEPNGPFATEREAIEDAQNA